MNSTTTFTMKGGEIYNNTCTNAEGGGVYVRGGGTFELDSPATTANVYGNTSLNLPSQVAKSPADPGVIGGTAGVTTEW